MCVPIFFFSGNLNIFVKRIPSRLIWRRGRLGLPSTLMESILALPPLHKTLRREILKRPVIKPYNIEKYM